MEFKRNAARDAAVPRRDRPGRDAGPEGRRVERPRWLSARGRRGHADQASRSRKARTARSACAPRPPKRSGARCRAREPARLEPIMSVEVIVDDDGLGARDRRPPAAPRPGPGHGSRGQQARRQRARPAAQHVRVLDPAALDDRRRRDVPHADAQRTTRCRASESTGDHVHVHVSRARARARSNLVAKIDRTMRIGSAARGPAHALVELTL